LRWWCFRSLRTPKELCAAQKKAPQLAAVPQDLSVLW
jgi:hypothetical protein